MFIKKSLKKTISIFLTVTFFTSCLMGQAVVLFANEQDINIIVTDNSELTSKSNNFSIEQNIDRAVITKNRIIFPKQFIPSSKGDRSSESGIYFWEERYWPRPKRIKTQPFNETFENDPGLFINDSFEEQENNNNNVPFYDTEYNNYSESFPLTINEPMFLTEQNIFSPETTIDEMENVNKMNDRFIIKYKNEKIKDDTVAKIKGNLKQSIHSKNEKFDIFVTENKMTVDNFKDLIKQKNADINIEYIQPDYQLTVASEDTPQLLETIQEVQEINNAPLNNTIDTTKETTSDTRAPSLLKIIFNETKIEIEYDENLKTDLLPSKTDFLVILNNGLVVQIESIEIKENILTLTTQTTLTTEDIVLVSYIPGTNPVTDPAGNPADGFNERKAGYTTAADTKSVNSNIDLRSPAKSH